MLRRYYVYLNATDKVTLLELLLIGSLPVVGRFDRVTLCGGSFDRVTLGGGSF